MSASLFSIFIFRLLIRRTCTCNDILKCQVKVLLLHTGKKATLHQVTTMLATSKNVSYLVDSGFFVQ